MKLIVALLFALAVVSTNGSFLRDPIPDGKQVTDEQIVNELKKEAVNVETTELADGLEKDVNVKKNIANARLGGWVKPAMVATGHFKKSAGIEEPVVLNNKKTTNASAVPKVKPMMIPAGGFAIRAKGLPKPSGLYKPEKMVGHGVLAKMAAEDNKDPEKAEELKELREKAAKIRSKQEGPACTDMDTYLKLARKLRREEELGKDGKTRKSLVKFVNLVCPVLKSSYTFILRCTSCEKMAKRMEMFYGDFDMKVFPGKKHPDRCDKEKWGTKNFVLEAALSSPNIFFGVDFCEKTPAEEAATGAASGPAAAKK